MTRRRWTCEYSPEFAALCALVVREALAMQLSVDMSLALYLGGE